MWRRLLFKINSTGAQFQAATDEVLTGIDQTCCQVDDILITGGNDEEHKANFREVGLFHTNTPMVLRDLSSL